LKSQQHLWLVPSSGRAHAFRWLRSRTFELPLKPLWRNAVFLVVVAGAAVFLGGEVLRTAYVAILGQSVEVTTLRRAVALDPANPELHHRLGTILCDSLAEADRTEGLKHLHRAAELNPYAARYWSDMAWACELAGDLTCVAGAVKQMVRLSPATPQWHWVAANSFLRLGQSDAALTEFHRVLELDPSYGAATFQVCLGTLGDPELILRRVLPVQKDPQLKLAFLNFLSEHELWDLAHQVWLQTSEAGVPFSFPLAEPYLDKLLQFGRIDEAQGVWRDLQALGIVSKPPADEQGNLVFNGDFEQTPLDAGLDWRHEADPYIALDLADESAHTGRLCLRIDFTVSRNEEHAPVYQWVPVAPNQAYRLTAYVRSQDITSDSGPRLRVMDPLHPDSASALSGATVGTTPWRQVGLVFCTGPDTKLVQLSIIRLRSRSFPSEITGSFWLDNVILKRSGPASPSACPALDHGPRT
jgi:tetratricopeptide (TPR) repeat protein